MNEKGNEQNTHTDDNKSSNSNIIFTIVFHYNTLQYNTGKYTGNVKIYKHFSFQFTGLKIYPPAFLSIILRQICGSQVNWD